MVEWCTQNLRRNGSISCGTSHATTTERYQYTSAVEINNTRYKKMHSLSQNHMRHVHSESGREQRLALYNAMDNSNNNNKKKKKKKKKKKNSTTTNNNLTSTIDHSHERKF